MPISRRNTTARWRYPPVINAWLDGLFRDDEILRPQPAGTFQVSRHSTSPVQPMLDI
jgi:hypothetical protein